MKQIGLNDTTSFYGKQDEILNKYRVEQESHKQLDTITMRSLASNLMYDQIQAQIIAKNIINKSIGIGDPSLVAISNVNAQIAAGIYNYKDEQPYDNLNALQDQPSQDLSNKEQPKTEFKQRIDTLNQGNEKEKEQELQQDKEFHTTNEIQQLDNEVLLDGQPQQQIDPQQKSLEQEETEQKQIEVQQAQQMIEMNQAMNYKLGSMDCGLNSLNSVQFPQKDISMRITDKTPSYIQMNKVLMKAEKVNQVKLKKNFISENQMLAQVEAQKELKKEIRQKIAQKERQKIKVKPQSEIGSAMLPQI
ncbi:MAG: hypothetical protein EZS28_033983 [Streblomastix strix]|uniref:Uncharacterized protein n=1 Tax=Streblomastix strix TaxID=222440 RepID=A0A5J4UIT7_9EUKA|nr:MAG: hypothetical protein EZS28_033983 [Streblomastix strix]